MFLSMTPVRSEKFTVNGTDYDLMLFLVRESGDYRLFVSKGGFGVGPSFTAKDDVVRDAMAFGGLKIVDTLIRQAKDDISRNEFGEY